MFYVPILKQHIFARHFFRLITLKSAVEALAVDHVRLNSLRWTKTAFPTPKRYDDHPHNFYMGVPVPGYRPCVVKHGLYDVMFIWDYAQITMWTNLVKYYAVQNLHWKVEIA